MQDTTSAMSTRGGCTWGPHAGHHLCHVHPGGTHVGAPCTAQSEPRTRYQWGGHTAPARPSQGCPEGRPPRVVRRAEAKEGTDDCIDALMNAREMPHDEGVR